MSTNDKIYNYLRGIGLTGSINDMLYKWYSLRGIAEGQNYYLTRTSLFGSGQQGAWYDPSNLNTLFQDAAGTVPVTAMEQPVGRMLDLSWNGNHAFQATTTKRGVVSRRVNLLTESEFRNGVSDAPTRSALVTAESIPGYLGALGIGWDGSTTVFAYKTVPVVSGASYKISAVVEMTDGDPPVFGSATPASPLNTFIFGVGNGFATAGTYVVVPLGGGLYRVSADAVAGNTVNNGIVKYPANDNRTFKVTAYSLTLVTDAHLPYQRVNIATDYDADPNKFPTYIRFDGTDDAYQTNNINFTGTDKMTVWSGVTALDMAAAVRQSGVIAGSNFGGLNGFAIVAPNNAGITSCASSGSSALAQATEGSLGGAPRSMMLTLLADQSAPYSINRRDGVRRANHQGTQGASGGYGNRPLYVGGDPGNRYFTGRLYGLIVAGANYTLPQTESIEYYMKRKMMLP